MSAQLKAAYDDLVTYLGKDAKGKEKAKRLKDAANELRKKLAVAEEKLAQMEAVKDAARERADAAEMENVALRIKNASLQQQVTTLASQVSEYGLKPLRIINAAPCTADTMHSVTQRLFAKLPKYPKQLAEMRVPEGYVSVFDREVLGEGWSDESLWQVGAAVALIASVEGSILVAASTLTCEHKQLVAAGPTWPAIRCAVSAWFGYDTSANSRDDEMQRAIDRCGPVRSVSSVTLG